MLPVLVALGIAGHVRRRRRVARILGGTGSALGRGAGDLSRFPVPRFALLVPAAALLGIAAAGPRWGTEVVETRSRSVNVVLALDVSKSMLASDVKPNRLERQRLLATRLLRELRGDRIGLVVFAGRAYVLSPLTVDHAALRLFVDALDPEIVSQGGSSLASALTQAADLARGEQPERGERAIVLISDGEALEDEAAVVQAAARAAQLGITVHTVAIGTPEGAPVPEVDPGTGRVIGYKRDPDGETVVSRRNDALLSRIARAAGGRFISADAAGATDLLLDELRAMQRTSTDGATSVQLKERFGWFVAVALALIALDAVLARAGAFRIGRGRAVDTSLELREAR
jgi:Ca-activated chloride channel family protein